MFRCLRACPCVCVITGLRKRVRAFTSAKALRENGRTPIVAERTQVAAFASAKLVIFSEKVRVYACLMLIFVVRFRCAKITISANPDIPKKTYAKECVYLRQRSRANGLVACTSTLTQEAGDAVSTCGSTSYRRIRARTEPKTGKHSKSRMR